VHSIMLEPSHGESHVHWHHGLVTREQRPHAGLTVWLTGLPGAGKSSVAFALERRLVASGRPAYVLDGDNLRHGLNADLGFSAEDRAENVRRVGEVARLLADAGVIAIAALISPYAADRARVMRSHLLAGLPFLEIYLDTPAEVCEKRDPHGLYARARAGQITGLTGVDDPYEPPESPHLRLRPEHGHAAAQAALLLELIGRTVTVPSPGGRHVP
jgi:bifunctional enzyme CysN/CysC